MKPGHKNALLIVMLCAAIALLYGQFLWNPLVFDDLPELDTHFSPFNLRSLPYASLEWGMELFGGQIVYFRIESLILHMAVAITLLFFLKGLFGRILGERRPSEIRVEWLAFFGALLFALHPVAVYGAGYLVQRTIVMATLFSLLAMLLWLKGCAHENKAWLWGSVLCYYLAVLSKEHAIMLPAVLVALTILLQPDWFNRLCKRLEVLSALALVALWVFLAKQGLLGRVYEIYAPDMLPDPGNGLNYPLSVLTQSWLFFKYVALWLFPNPNWMSVDMREPFATSIWSPYLVAFAAFLGWGWVSLRLLLKRGRLGLLGFALLFPWLMFMPEFSTIRIQESFVLYRSYLWAAGACALLPLLLDRWDKYMAAIVAGAAALAMIPVSMDRLASFSHPLILWDDAVKLVKDRQDLPGVYRIYYNRGTELLKNDYYDEAIADLSLSSRLNPEWPFPYNNLGSAYLKKQDWQAAVDAYSKAIAVAERNAMGVNPKPYLGRALAYENLGMTALARKDFEVSCKVGNIGCAKLAK